MQSELRKLRTSLKKTRCSLTPAERMHASQALCRRVAQLPVFRACRTIALYIPTPAEIDISELFERAWLANKQVYLPIVAREGLRFAHFSTGDKLARNSFGIPEPTQQPLEIPPRQLDLVITPVLGFDEYCHRIGMGGGFYDRTFQFLIHRHQWLKPKLLGVAFECQKLNSIRAQPWDVPMWCVATDKTVYTRKKQKE